MVPRALQNEQQIKQEMLPNSSKFHHVHMLNDLCLSFQTDHGTDWVCRSYKQMTVSKWILHGDVIACGPWGMPWFSTVWLQLPCIEIASITYNASQLCRVKEILTKPEIMCHMTVLQKLSWYLQNFSSSQWSRQCARECTLRAEDKQCTPQLLQKKFRLNVAGLERYLGW